MRVNSFGISYPQLTARATLIDHSVDTNPSWSSINRAWKAIGNYPLSHDWITHLRNDVIDIGSISLWALYNPTVLIYRWANGELAYFLVSDDGHLFQSPENMHFLKYFPFVRIYGNSVEFELEQCPTVEISSAIAWLPQSNNYSHFLCDSLAPWIPFMKWLSNSDFEVSLLQVDHWPIWQKEFISQSILDSTVKVDLSKSLSQLVIFKPEAVYFPCANNIFQRQYILRKAVEETTNLVQRCSAFPENIVLLSRSDYKNKRIRNIDEISRFILSMGGRIIDPSKLTNLEKVCAIGNAAIIVCEGSGALNSVLFGSENSRTIWLADPALCQNKDLLLGSWPYQSFIAHRTSFFLGRNPSPLSGSPLASCSFPLEQFRDIVATLK